MVKSSWKDFIKGLDKLEKRDELKDMYSQAHWEYLDYIMPCDPEWTEGMNNSEFNPLEEIYFLFKSSSDIEEFLFECAKENLPGAKEKLRRIRQIRASNKVYSSRQIKSSKDSDKIVANTREEFYDKIENLGYEIIDDSDGKWLTLENFPDVYKAKYTRYSDGDYELMLYNIHKTGNRLESSRQIQSFIQSAVDNINEEDPVEVLLKDAAEHFGATYKEGWYGKGIQEGDGAWSGGEWAILVDSNPSSEIPEIHFIAAKGNNKVVPMNAKTADSETFPTDLIDWIKNKIRESKEEVGDFEDQVVVFKEADVENIDYIDSNPSTRTVYIKTATKSDDEAKDIAQKFVEITGNENYEIYDFYETSEDSYDDLDPDIRDEKVIIFNL